MRAILISLFLLAVGCTSSTETVDTFNNDWQFTLGEMDTNPFESGDVEAESVRIPHDWSIDIGYTEENTAGSNAYLPGGVGWYRKSFSVPSEWLDKSVAIHFEGVYNNSQVWINGEDLGFFPNGYLDFEYELTPYLKSGKNDIVVRVDRRAYADARWYAGAGIYRPVHLLVRNNTHIPTHGQFISTPEVSRESAKVSVVSEVISSDSDVLSADYQIKFADNIISSSSSVLRVVDGVAKNNVEFTIENPQLWSCETPQQYELVTVIKSGDEVVDERVEQFGIRTIEFNADKGFLLNGESVKIKGVNIHHDLGCVGAALYDKVLYRRLKVMQDMGVNAIRTAHNPHSESMYNMCDTMGLLVMNEFSDEWRVAKDKWIISRFKPGLPDSLQLGYSQYYDEFMERDMKDFLRRDYNHPSVVLISIGNEIEWTYPYYFASSIDRKGYTGLVFKGEPEKNRALTIERFKELSKGDDELSRTAQELAQWVRDVDTTRPVTSGVVIPSVSRISGYTDALDVVGYNYKDEYYEGDHKLYPEKSIVGSENVGQYFEWAAVTDKEYIPGIFLWTGVDYLGENGPWPLRCGDYSLFNLAGFKTPRGHFFETLWLDTPKSYMVTTPADESEFKLQSDGSFVSEWRNTPLRRWEWYVTYDKWKYESEEPIVVQVYTNAAQVDLQLNGKSLGVKSRSEFSQENVMLWQVPYSAGELVAIGLDESGKEESRYTLRTAGEVSNIVALSDSEVMKSGERDLAHIELSLVDAAGTLVVDCDEVITISCSDNCRVLAVDNASTTFKGDHQANEIESWNGRALVIVEPTEGAKGTATVTFTTQSGLSQSVSMSIE